MDGDQQIRWAPRVEVPNQLWELIEETAKVMEVTPKWVFKMLFKRLEHMALTGQVGALGFEFEQALRQLNNKGLLFDDVREEDQHLLTSLHRSTRAKSGFVGVYSNGKGFRAEGKDPKTRSGAITLGTFPTAEGAALARFSHYKRHGMPYGQLEELMDQMRQREDLARTWSEDRLKHEVIWFQASVGQPIPGLTPEERALEQTDPMRAGG